MRTWVEPHVCRRDAASRPSAGDARGGFRVPLSGLFPVECSRHLERRARELARISRWTHRHVATPDRYASAREFFREPAMLHCKYGRARLHWNAVEFIRFSESTEGACLDCIAGRIRG